MSSYKVEIWHANTIEGMLSAAASGSASIPLDIAADHTLRHTIEVEASDDLSACIEALTLVLPPLPPLEPGQIHVITSTPDRRTTAGDILIVQCSKTKEVKGLFLWREGFTPNDFIRMQALSPTLSGRILH